MKKSSFLTRLFSHNIVLLIISFLLAFIAWFIINANSETETNVTISNIPISITLPDTALDKGYQVFRADDSTASVEVSGNRVSVGSLTPSDIQVFANQVSTIDHADEYSLPLSAKKVGIKTNYNIMSSVTPPTVTFFADKFKEKDLPIDKSQMKVVVDSGDYSEITMSNDTVHLEGAAAKVDEIEYAMIVDTVKPEGSSPITLQESLVFYDKNKKEVTLKYVEADIKSVEVTVTTQPKKEISLALEIINEPQNAPAVTLTPAKVSIYGPAEQIDTIKDNQVIIGTLDYGTLTNTAHKIPYDISLPDSLKDCHIIADSEETVTANLDLSDYVSTTLTVPVTTKVDTAKYSAEIASGTTVKLTVYGPASVIKRIAAKYVTVVADLTKMADQLDEEKTVSVLVPLTVTFADQFKTCWAYHTDPVNVNVTPKTK